MGHFQSLLHTTRGGKGEERAVFPWGTGQKLWGNHLGKWVHASGGPRLMPCDTVGLGKTSNKNSLLLLPWQYPGNLEKGTWWIICLQPLIQSLSLTRRFTSSIWGAALSLFPFFLSFQQSVSWQPQDECPWTTAPFQCSASFTVLPTASSIITEQTWERAGPLSYLGARPFGRWKSASSSSFLIQVINKKERP